MQFLKALSLAFWVTFLLTSSSPAQEFRKGGTYFMGGPATVVAADFNTDGFLDMLTGDTGGVYVRLGAGDGSFGSKISSTTSDEFPKFTVVADFNRDGKMDVLVGPTAVILLGNGDGTFQLPLGENFGPSNSGAVVADFNGDGELDVAVSNNRGGGSQNGSVAVAFGNGDGTFQNPTFYAAGLRPNSIALGDFNGDGIADLLVGTAGINVTVLLGRADGTFGKAISTKIGASPSYVATADINGDGKLDLITTLIGAVGQNDKVVVALGQGNRTFGQPTTVAVAPSLAGTVVADLNNDGFLDLIVTNHTLNSGSLEVFLGNGDGTFQRAQEYEVGINGATAAAVGDLNLNGYLDLLVANSENVQVLLNNGTSR